MKAAMQIVRVRRSHPRLETTTPEAMIQQRPPALAPALALDPVRVRDPVPAELETSTIATRTRRPAQIAIPIVSWVAPTNETALSRAAILSAASMEPKKSVTTATHPRIADWGWRVSALTANRKTPAASSASMTLTVRKAEAAL